MKNKTTKVILLISILSAFKICICYGQNSAVLSFSEAKALADRGDARAQAIVALHYQLGWQTEKNELLAVQYATASAEARNPLGFFRLGSLLVSGVNGKKDEQNGYKLQAASGQGLMEMAQNRTNPDPYAMTAIGIINFQGKICPQNKSNAINWYRAAAEQGFAPAIYNYIMAAIGGQGMEKDPVAFYHFINGAGGNAGCECASCKYKRISYYNNISSLMEKYPPAVSFINQNSNRVVKDLAEMSKAMGETKYEEKYWKYKINQETQILEPSNLRGETSKWNKLISINTDTGTIDVEVRANYTGLIKETEVDEKKYSMIQDYPETHCMSYGGLFSTVQYYVKNDENGLTIQSTTPLKFKNRMGVCEYPIALEVKVVNNSGATINLEQFGFFVQNCEVKKEIIPGIIFETNENSSENKMIVHNFGWGDWNPDTEAKITLWDQSTSISESSMIKISSNKSDAKKAVDLFKNKFLLHSLFNAPEYACRKISLSAPISGKYEQVIFEPSFTRTAADFYLKIKGDAILPSDRSNYRFLFNSRKEMLPGETYTFNTTFEFNKSVNCNLKPLVKIDGKSREGGSVKMDYETYNFFYDPKETLPIDGNGGDSIANVQKKILGLGTDNLDEKNKDLENKIILESSKKALAENNIKTLIQSSSGVIVHDKVDGEDTIYEKELATGQTCIRITARNDGSSLIGHVAIMSKDRNQVVFRTPWTFDDMKAGSGAFKLSVVNGVNNQWIAWYIKDDNKGRLYCVFPGKISTVFAPTSPNAPLQEGGAYYRIVNIGSETENDIEALGIDPDSKGLVIKTKKIILSL